VSNIFFKKLCQVKYSTFKNTSRGPAFYSILRRWVVFALLNATACSVFICLVKLGFKKIAKLTFPLCHSIESLKNVKRISEYSLVCHWMSEEIVPIIPILPYSGIQTKQCLHSIYRLCILSWHMIKLFKIL